MPIFKKNYKSQKKVNFQKKLQVLEKRYLHDLQVLQAVQLKKLQVNFQKN